MISNVHKRYQRWLILKMNQYKIEIAKRVVETFPSEFTNSHHRISCVSITITILFVWFYHYYIMIYVAFNRNKFSFTVKKEWKKVICLFE